ASPAPSPHQAGSTPGQPPAPAAGGLRVNAPKKWGPSGFNARKPSVTSEISTVPAASPATSQQPPHATPASSPEPSRTQPSLAQTHPNPDDLRRRAAQEKMAGALFAGIGSNSSSTTTAPPPRQAPTAGPRSMVGKPGYTRPKAGSVASVQSAAPKPQPAEAVDLLDLFGTPTSEESQQQQQATTEGSPVFTSVGPFGVTVRFLVVNLSTTAHRSEILS
ncbi:AP-4 complex subunit epsilon-1, partial [Perkinsus olseni]